jgi:hypothetical protein
MRVRETVYLLTVAALALVFAVAAVWVSWPWLFAAFICLGLLADKAL